MRLQKLRTVLSLARRDVTCIALSLALGAVFAPTFADRAVAQAVQQRVASCAGFDFHPIDNRTTYRWEDRVLYRLNNAGDGWFLCSAHLPHKAVVKQVRFMVKDIPDKSELRYCALIRTPLAVAGAVQAMAVMQSTGVAADPGIIRVSDTSIAFATVDNATSVTRCSVRFISIHP